MGVTVYVCSRCKGVSTTAWGGTADQLCRSCHLGTKLRFTDYAREEQGRVGATTELVTIVFPDGRIVKMNVNGNKDLEVTDTGSNGLTNFMKIKRKIREDLKQ